MRGLANHIGLDVGGVSRMFAGKRKMKAAEVERIARFLEVPAEEIIKRAGAPDLMKFVRTFEVEAEIQQDGTVTALKKSRPLPASVIARAEAQIEGSGPVSIAQVRIASGPMSLFDDAVLVYEKVDYVEPAAVGVLSIMKLRDGVQMLGRIKSMRKTGEAEVIGTDGKERTLDVVSAAPVRVVP